LAILLVTAVLLRPELAKGQSPAVRSSSGVHTTLPVVPHLEPRPSEGTAANQKWRTLRTDEERRPVADFLDTIKGNDASIEVIVNQSKLLTTKEPISREDGVAVIAVGDPTVLEFDVLPDPRMIRLVGRRVGVTDLMVVTADGETCGFEVHVVHDLALLRAQLRQVFPDAHIKLGQIREHLVVEGQARSAAQIQQILNALRYYLDSVQASRQQSGQQDGGQDAASNLGSTEGPEAATPEGPPFPEPPFEPGPEPTSAFPDSDGTPGSNTAPDVLADATESIGGSGQGSAGMSTQAEFPRGEIINLLRVPGVHQVMLKVRIAELNRTALREIGATGLCT